MSASQGSNHAQEAVGLFTEALRGRIGADRFRLWFTHGVTFEPRTHDDAAAVMTVWASGPFAAQRIAKHFHSELRAAAMIALGEAASFRIEHREHESADTPSESEDRQSTCIDSKPSQVNACLSTQKSNASEQRSRESIHIKHRSSIQPAQRSSKSTGPQSLKHLMSSSRVSSQRNANDDVQFDPSNDQADAVASSMHTSGLAGASSATGPALESFITGSCNDFAFSATMMAITTPAIATPLFLHGPSGTGKSHLLTGLAETFRMRRRMRRVIMLSAEQFTNDFIASVNSTGLPAFRRRYRDVDALLIDDVHFLATKTATLREMLYTVETLVSAGKPLVFTANLPPAEIRGLTSEVAGRMASGLVCPLTPLDAATRLAVLQRATTLRCVLGCNEALLEDVAELAPGDARSLQGVANLIGMLQRMYRREPTLAEIQQFGGDLLRCQTIAPTLRSIERAVCDAFGLESDGLRGRAQTRRVSEPRMLAMYLAREMTGSAYTEIARHFGRRSHTGAIAAQAKVGQWLKSNKPIGGGQS
ncbi:MAG: DnaA/Hda family protein, partial [Planctomycetota bacterium]